MKGCKSVDEYIERAPAWGDELAKLRSILDATDLVEEVKWGAPCYTYGGKNVVGLMAFRDYFGLWFHQGALLSDPRGALINAQEGKTRALRQWRMRSKRDIAVRAVRAYVEEAIGLVEEGREIRPQRGGRVVVPAELKAALEGDAQARAAFAQLTPGRRREYAEHVAEAKRPATRVSRAEKALPRIARGEGLNDRYR